MGTSLAGGPLWQQKEKLEHSSYTSLLLIGRQEKSGGETEVGLQSDPQFPGKPIDYNGAFS